MLNIRFIEVIPSNIEEKMQAGFVQYEKDHDIDINYTSFCLVLTIGNNEVVGVLKAYTAFAEIYIDDIWVDEHYRGKGFGKKLIHKLEDSFIDKGYNNINLVTSAFQAPEFYKKCGLELEFIRKNIKNPKLTKFFFIKYFKDENEFQDLL